MLLDLSSFVNLPMVWSAIIAVAILLYILLDGFVLGVGILIPFAPKMEDKHQMMRTVAPFWDANQTWLVLGGGGLLAAFPLAYSILMGAFYVPLIAMLLCLVFRGSSFEFYFKEKNTVLKHMWLYFFHFGSLGAAFFQGSVLGAYIQGVSVTGRSFSGGAFEWASAFSMITGAALIFGYGLLGAAWTQLKSQDRLHRWSHMAALYCSIFMVFFSCFVFVFMPFLRKEIFLRWFSFPSNIFFLSLFLILIGTFVFLWKGLWQKNEKKIFLCSFLIFVFYYLALLATIYPWMIPYHYKISDAMAHPASLSLMLIGVIFVLPCILFYTIYTYTTFWGKEQEKHHFY